MTDWGCPDWSNAAAYPARPDDLEDWQWRWEFLRRLPEYREAWERAEELATVRIGLDEDRGTRVPAEEDKDYAERVWNLRFEIYDPRKPLSDLGSEMVFSEPPNITGFLLGAAVLDLNIDRMGFSDKSRERTLRKFVQRVKAIHELERERKIALVAFDLERPLAPQFRAARKDLDLKAQNTVVTKRNRRANWVRHLRVIDAKDQEATHSSIYDCFAAEKAGDNDDLMDDHYRIGRQPAAVVAGWHKAALGVMRKAAILP